MLVVTAIFEDGKFVPDRPLLFPQSRRVTLTIDEENLQEAKSQNHNNQWREFSREILNCEEKMPDGFPIPLANFRSPKNLDLL